MRYFKTLGFVAAVIAVSGCAQVPVDYREPYKTVELNLPPEQVYAGMNKYPTCVSGIYPRGSFDSTKRSFEIRYYVNSVTLTSEVQTDYVFGELTEGGGTSLVMRSLVNANLGTPSSGKILNQFQIGSCDG